MALEITPLTSKLLQENNVEANIILEIEDDAFPEIFGLVSVTRSLRIDDWYFGDGSVIGGTIEDPASKDWIQERGTTNSLTQKVDTDKPGGASSIQTFTVSLIDKNNELTNIFSPGIRVPDILGLRATAYWAATGAAHPEDSTAVFRGIISDITFGAGNVSIIIDSPETLKRQELLPQYISLITSAIDDTVTTIPVTATTGYIESFEDLTSYIRIKDEIIEVGSISGTDFIDCVRGALGTTAIAHDINEEATSFYRLENDSPVDLALKMIVSGIGEFSEIIVRRVNQITDTLFIQNAILIKSETFEEDSGLVVGDTISITLAVNAANNVTDRAIVEFSVIPEGTVIRLAGTDMVNESGSLNGKFKSQYDVLNFGGAIDPFHIDIARFIQLKDLLSLQHPALDIYIRDTINLEEFLNDHVLFPSGMFSLFRKGRISVGANLPPLISLGVKTLSIDSVKDAVKIKTKRSIKRFFYNAVVYKYNENALDDRFLTAKITQSSDSTNRINIGNKALTIEAKGIRDSERNTDILDIQSRRLLDRYQYGAEQVEISTNFKTGFPIEVGDSVILEGDGLQLSDSTQGSRDYSPRVLEIFNKKISLKKGDVKLKCIDSNYDSGVRYGTISPASFLDAGSTTLEIVLKRSFNTGEFVSESVKWQDYIQQKIQVRSQDFAFSEVVTITGIKPGNPNILQIAPALSVAPSEDYIIESPNYDESTAKANRYWKSLHAYPTAKVDVLTGASSTSFTVGAGDIGKFIEDLNIRVHSPDFTDNSGDVTILDVTGTTVTTEDLGFTPDSTSLVDVEHFGDNGVGYRYF